MPRKTVEVRDMRFFSAPDQLNEHELDVEFDFSNRDIIGEVGEICRYLEKKSLKGKLCLNFTGLPLREQDIVNLGVFLKSSRCPPSINLILTQTNLSRVSLQCLAQTMLEASNVSDLRLGLCGNQLGDEGVKILAQALGTQAPSAKSISINLANNRISDEGFMILADMLKLQRGAKSLSLNLLFNSESPVGAEKLIDGIKYAGHRERLAITYEFAKHEHAISSLAAALQSDACPKELCLQFGTVHIHHEAIHILFSALASVVSLKQLELNLSEQGLKDNDLDAILTALENIKEDLSIKLSLVYNQFGFAGAQSLSAFIGRNQVRTPIHLDLSQNSFGQAAGIELLDSTLSAHHQILTYLSLKGPTEKITRHSVAQEERRATQPSLI